jgi:hypothetical protein
MKRWLLRTNAGEGAQYELVPGETTLIGRSASFADFIITAMSPGGALFSWRDGAWHVLDPGNSNGLYVKRTRIVQAQLSEGDVVRAGRVNLRLECFDAAPLDDVHEYQGWVCFGRRRPLDHGGRWPAFRRHAAMIERAMFDGDAFVPGAAGIPLALFAEALRASPDEASAFTELVATTIAQDASEYVTSNTATGDAGDFMVTWEGALVRLSRRRFHGLLAGESVDEWLPRAPHVHIDSESESDAHVDVSPQRLAALVRGLFPDAWRAELELREQLAALDDDGVRWLLERAKMLRS